MESTDYLHVLLRRWKVILSAGILAMLAVWLLAPAGTPGLGSGSYTATATLVQDPGTPRSVKFTALLVTTGSVPRAAAKDLAYTGDPVSLGNSLTVKADIDTGAVTIAATSTDPQEAARIVNAFAQETVAEMRRRWVAGVQPGISVLQDAVVEPAETGVLRGPKSQGGRLLLGLVVGVILGSALALVLERFDTSVRDRTGVQRAYRVPVLAEVPRLPRALRGAHSVILRTHPMSMAAEAFRSLRSSVLLMPSRVLQPADPEAARPDAAPERSRPQVILVASARSGEGKTTTAVNLAAALAEGGQRVLVLDCDFRRPEAHRFLDVPNGPGLSDLIHAGDGVADLLALSRPTVVDGVRLVPAGTMVDQPPALPTRVAGVLAEARGLADVVIVDSSPMLVGNDAMDLMPYVDTVLVTCRSGRLTRDQADRASDLLVRMRVPVVGAALIGAGPTTPPLSHLLSHRSSANGSSERRARLAEPAAVRREP
jgi:Mrp family chromosome partitioning ATPase/capsular polysaccharide biosynthesis protein